MLTVQIQDLLRQLRAGKLKAPDAAILAQLSWDDFVLDLRAVYPVVFQERSVGRKRELGMAKSMAFEIVIRQPHDSQFPAVHLFPVLRDCVFVSAYDNSVSEITTATFLRVQPTWGTTHEVQLTMGRGHKLDRTPDGWTVKPLKRKNVALSEDFLVKRGWKSDALVPFSSHP